MTNTKNPVQVGHLPWTVRWYDEKTQESNQELANKAMTARFPLLVPFLVLVLVRPMQC
jgi:protein subunit release factor A